MPSANNPRRGINGPRARPTRTPRTPATVRSHRSSRSPVEATVVRLSAAGTRDTRRAPRVPSPRFRASRISRRTDAHRHGLSERRLRKRYRQSGIVFEHAPVHDRCSVPARRTEPRAASGEPESPDVAMRIACAPGSPSRRARTASPPIRPGPRARIGAGQLPFVLDESGRTMRTGAAHVRLREVGRPAPPAEHEAQDAGHFRPRTDGLGPHPSCRSILSIHVRQSGSANTTASALPA